MFYTFYMVYSFAISKSKKRPDLIGGWFSRTERIFAFASFERATTNMKPPPPAPHKLTAEIHGAIRAMISSTSGLVLPGSSAFFESQ